MREVRLDHHDLCFGCGLANVFGLHFEAQPDGPDGVVGRFFVKQDHQGPDGGAHPGIVTAALLEAIALAGGRPAAAEVALGDSPPLGVFVRVEARPDGAAAFDESTGKEVASARCPRT